MGKSLEEIEALSSWELTRWREYHAVEPLPDPHWDMAQTCSVIANVNRSGGKAFTVDDFLPRLAPKKKKMSTEEMWANFRAATARCR